MPGGIAKNPALSPDAEDSDAGVLQPRRLLGQMATASPNSPTSPPPAWPAPPPEPKRVLMKYVPRPSSVNATPPAWANLRLRRVRQRTPPPLPGPPPPHCAKWREQEGPLDKAHSSTPTGGACAHRLRRKAGAGAAPTGLAGVLRRRVASAVGFASLQTASGLSWVATGVRDAKARLSGARGRGAAEAGRRLAVLDAVCALLGAPVALEDVVEAAMAPAEEASLSVAGPPPEEEASRVWEASAQAAATAAGAVGGAVALGAAGGTAGFATGSVVGMALGLAPALVTFGLSVPIGAALGGGAGLFTGAAAGGVVGAVGGGAAGYGAYSRRGQLLDLAASGVAKVAQLAEAPRSPAVGLMWKTAPSAHVVKDAR